MAPADSGRRGIAGSRGRPGEGWNQNWNNWVLHEQGILVTDADHPVLHFFRHGVEKPINTCEIPEKSWIGTLR